MKWKRTSTFIDVVDHSCRDCKRATRSRKVHSLQMSYSNEVLRGDMGVSLFKSHFYTVLVASFVIVTIFALRPVVEAVKESNPEVAMVNVSVPIEELNRINESIPIDQLNMPAEQPAVGVPTDSEVAQNEVVLPNTGW